MSVQESKKKSSSLSSKRSKEEHQDEKDADEIPVEAVHTANDWEHADLGDNQRKQKFLRLMGAKKRKDESQVNRQDSNGSNPDEDVSREKKHCRSKVENETIERELEKQFNEGLQSKIIHRHHGGLGFHGETSGGASSSSDWKHESTKNKFVPAKTEDGSSLDQIHVDKKKKNDDEDNDEPNDKEKKSSEKQEKKKKSKS